MRAVTILVLAALFADLGAGQTSNALAADLAGEVQAGPRTLVEQQEPTFPTSPLRDDLAVERIREVVSAAQLRKDLEPQILASILAHTRVMAPGWKGRTAPLAPDWALTRALYALEWAVRTGDNVTLATIASDLAAKADDCRTKPEGRFGDVMVTIRTVLPDGQERRGLRVRYLERFYWTMLSRVPTLANRWQEFPTVSAIVGAPVTAGEWMIVAQSADGKDVSDPKPISVGGNRPAQFDLVVR